MIPIYVRTESTRRLQSSNFERNTDTDDQCSFTIHEYSNKTCETMAIKIFKHVLLFMIARLTFIPFLAFDPDRSHILMLLFREQYTKHTTHIFPLSMSSFFLRLLCTIARNVEVATNGPTLIENAYMNLVMRAQ